MQTIFSVYDQLARMLARLDPQMVLSMKASEEMQQRFDLLVQKKQNESLSNAEKDELDHFIVLERLMRLAKISAEGTTAAI